MMHGRVRDISESTKGTIPAGIMAGGGRPFRVFGGASEMSKAAVKREWIGAGGAGRDPGPSAGDGPEGRCRGRHRQEPQAPRTDQAGVVQARRGAAGGTGDPRSSGKTLTGSLFLRFGIYFLFGDRALLQQIQAL